MSLCQELTEKLQLLTPEEGDVFVVTVPEDAFGEDGLSEDIMEFAEAIHDATDRDVFVIVEGHTLMAVPDPRAASDP